MLQPSFVPQAAAVAAPQFAAPQLNVQRPDNPFDAPEGVKLRAVGDVGALRESIYDSVLRAASEMPEVVGNQNTLRLTDLHYAEDDPEFDAADEKKAILSGSSLSRRLRGTWNLIDNATGESISSRKATVANVPAILRDGSFLRNGTRYAMGYQQRLKPGAYARYKKSGEPEVFVNPLSGSGRSHRYVLEPETGLFHVHIEHAKIPLVPLLQTLGVSREQIESAWGKELTDKNFAKQDSKAVNKLYERFVSKHEQNAEDRAVPERVAAKIQQAIASIKLDPEVVDNTLGRASDTLDGDLILKGTSKALRMLQGQEDADDRDNLAFASYHGAADIFAERFMKDYGKFRRELLYKAGRKGTLDSLPSGALDKYINAAIFRSGLGQAVEEVNPIEIAATRMKITRFGEGGLADATSAPAESRDVHPSQFGYIDSVTTPESLRIGIDGFLAANSMIGSDNKLYAKMIDNKTGRQVVRSPDKLLRSSVSLGNAPMEGYEMVSVRGRLRMLPKGTAEYSMPNMEDSFSVLGNMVPMKGNMFGQRASMGARMASQAMALETPQAPWVQTGTPDDLDESFEERFGKQLGAIRSEERGRVVELGPDHVTVKYAGGREQRHVLDNNRPGARKSIFHQTPMVELGQEVEPNQLLVKSNYVDDKGVAAMGTNARTALMAWPDAWEDGIVVSQSFADKTRIQQAYKYKIQPGEGEKVDKRGYLQLFGNRYKSEQLANIGNDGVIKVGTMVKEGDPLMLGMRKRDGAKTRVHKQSKMDWGDSSVRWDHAHEGVVTDVFHSDKGSQVVVKTAKPLEESDKLCYDPETEMLTRNGWKSVTEITVDDEVATLDPLTDTFTYMNPAEVQRFKHRGRMYKLQTTQVDLLVTDNHNLYAKRGKRPYQLIQAKDLFGLEYRMQKNGNWHGQSPEHVVFPAVTVAAGQFGRGTRVIPEIKMPVQTYLMLLGMFLSEGSVFSQAGGNYGIDICQIKPAHRSKLLTALAESGLKFNEHGVKTKVRLYGLQLYNHFRQFGKSTEKYIPPEVFDWSTDDLRVLYHWMMWGDGGQTQSGHIYYTSSARLADDVQQLLLHIGMSGTITSEQPERQKIKGVWYDIKRRYMVSVLRHKNRPTINHAHVKKQSGQLEGWQMYSGDVHCVTMPEHHVVYVRRNGKTVWSGNSGRFGNKGVITIKPDSEMPHDQEGNPIELIVSPLAVPSRGNSSFPLELLLGKIAAKRGAPFKIKDFRGNDLQQMAMAEAEANGVNDTETLIDPKTGRKIPGVLTGQSFVMALHHLASSKSSARGLGTYSADDSPARGGEEGAQAKRYSGQMAWAGMSHGAYNMSREATLLRGVRNDDYWNAFMGGEQIAPPRISPQYDAFVSRLQASGINPIRSGTKTQLMAMIDADVDDLAGNRIVTSPNTVDVHKDLKPLPNGLFDPKLFGDGTRWAAIQLSEPSVNPAFEEPLRRMLGLTEKEFREVLGGKKELGNFGSGPDGLKKRLDSMDIDQEITKAREAIAGTRKVARDEAVKRLKYLKALKDTDTRPSDLMITKVPVLPPRLRPISKLGGKGGVVVSDPNFLYRELMFANEVVNDLKGSVDDLSSERLAVYDAHRALVGLTDPASRELRQRKVKGLIKQITGDNPKSGVVQRKLISGNVDTVGRGVIAPDTSLDMDSFGLPENLAFDMYQPYIVRNMALRGIPRVAALEHLKNRDDVARRSLLAELDKRPVTLSRAPILHKYGDIALMPRLIKGDAIRLNPLVYGPLGGDNDGDAVNLNIPHSREAVSEAFERMLPSKMLIATSNFKSPMFKPTQDLLLGLHIASKPARTGVKTRYFGTLADAKAALNRGDIDVDTPVKIGDRPNK